MIGGTTVIQSASSIHGQPKENGRVGTFRSDLKEDSTGSAYRLHDLSK